MPVLLPVQVQVVRLEPAVQVQQVQVLRIRDQHREGQDDQHVRPPVDALERHAGHGHARVRGPRCVCVRGAWCNRCCASRRSTCTGPRRRAGGCAR